MNQVLLAEANFGLRRVHIDVDLLGRHLQKEQDDRKGGRRNHIPIRLADGVQQQPVADQPFVYKDIDRVPVQLLQLRFRKEAGEPQRYWLTPRLIRILLPGGRVPESGSFQWGLRRNREELAQRLGAEDLVDPLGRPRYWRSLQQGMRRR